MPPHTEMDLDTMKAIAELSARTAAQEVAESLRKDFREDLRKEFTELETRLKEKLELELRSHFGTMQPDEHIIQHSRLDRLMKLSEQATGGFFKALVSKLATWLLSLMAAGFLYTMASGHNPFKAS